MKKLLLIGLLLGVSLFGFAATANASAVMTGDNVYYGADLKGDGTLYAAGKTVVVAGAVDGDLFCAGQTVEITGTVEGDVICAAQQLTIKGEVKGDIRVAGQTVDIDNVTAGSATVFGQTVNIRATAKVGHDLTLGAQTAVLAGSVARDINGGAESLILSGVVGRNINVSVEQLAIASTAKLSGGLQYASTNQASIAQGAVLASEPVRNDPPAKTHIQPASALTRATIAAYWFAAFLLIGLAVMLFKPKLLPRTAERVRIEPGAVFGWGVLGLVAPPTVSVLLMVTFIGMPLGLLILAMWAAVLLLATAVAAHAIGRLLLGVMGAGNVAAGWLQVLSLLVGLSVLLAISFIPVVGGLVMVVAVVLGTGGLLDLAKHGPTKLKTAKVQG